MAEQGISVGALEEAAGELRRDGATAIFIGIDGRRWDPGHRGSHKGLDAVRLEALEEQGIRVVMVTGDNRTTSEAVAAGSGS